MAFPTSVTVKNKCLLFKPPYLWSCYSSLGRLIQGFFCQLLEGLASTHHFRTSTTPPHNGNENYIPLRTHSFLKSLTALLRKFTLNCHHPVAKNSPEMQEAQEMWVQSLGREDRQEEGIATHSGILSGKIPCTRGAWWAIIHGVTHDLSDWAARQAGPS